MFLPASNSHSEVSRLTHIMLLFCLMLVETLLEYANMVGREEVSARAPMLIKLFIIFSDLLASHLVPIRDCSWKKVPIHKCPCTEML